MKTKTKTKTRTRLIIAVLVACTCLVSESNAQQDVVLLKPAKGRSSNVLGRITATTKDSVEVTKGTKKRKVNVNEIRRVTFGSEPGGLKSARQAVMGEQYEQALEALNRVEPDNRDTKFIRTEIEFYKAYAAGQLALRNSANANAAARGLVSFLKKNKNSFHVYESKVLLGDLAVALGNFDAAVRSYGDYASAPFPEYKIRGGILEANALRATEQYAAAEKRYADVLRIPATGEEATRQKTLAEIGKAACTAARGNHAEALQVLQQIIDLNDPTDGEIFAPAYNAKGLAYRKAGKNMDAALAYLHVDVLFFNQRNEHAEALYNLSSIWNDLNKPGRAVEARKTLSQRYGGTVWAKRS
ncbi:hypothetical protein ACFL2H_01540 [Planctomycetota bacterium]